MNAISDREALATVLNVARNSANELELAQKLGWGEADLTTAKYVLKRAREGIDVDTAAREGIVRTALLHTPRNV